MSLIMLSPVQGEKVLGTIARITGADRSLGTLRCSFKAAEDVSTQVGDFKELHMDKCIAPPHPNLMLLS